MVRHYSTLFRSITTTYFAADDMCRGLTKPPAKSAARLMAASPRHAVLCSCKMFVTPAGGMLQNNTPSARSPLVRCRRRPLLAPILYSLHAPRGPMPPCDPSRRGQARLGPFRLCQRMARSRREGGGGCITHLPPRACIHAAGVAPPRVPGVREFRFQFPFAVIMWYGSLAVGIVQKATRPGRTGRGRAAGGGRHGEPAPSAPPPGGRPERQPAGEAGQTEEPTRQEAKAARRGWREATWLPRQCSAPLGRASGRGCEARRQDAGEPRLEREHGARG